MDSLPSELISEIFLDYVWTSDPWSRSWLDIMLVCRRWRDIAIDDSRLWAFISEHCPDPSLWLVRAKEQLLMCRIDLLYNSPAVRRNQSYHCFKTVCHNMHRVKWLYLKGNKSHIASLFSATPRDVANLTILVVDLHPSVDDRHPATALTMAMAAGHVSLAHALALSNAFMIPQWVFKYPQMIKSLHLHETFITLEQLRSLSNLSHLELDHGRDGPHPTLKDIFSILRHLPDLETLHLVGCIDRRDEYIPDDVLAKIPGIELLSLQRIKLSLTFEQLVAMLAVLYFPLSASLSIFLPKAWPHFRLVTHIQRHLCERIYGAGTRSLSIDWGECSSYEHRILSIASHILVDDATGDLIRFSLGVYSDRRRGYLDLAEHPILVAIAHIFTIFSQLDVTHLILANFPLQVQCLDTWTATFSWFAKPPSEVTVRHNAKYLEMIEGYRQACITYHQKYTQSVSPFRAPIVINGQQPRQEEEPEPEVEKFECGLSRLLITKAHPDDPGPFSIQDLLSALAKYRDTNFAPRKPQGCVIDFVSFPWKLPIGLAQSLFELCHELELNGVKWFPGSADSGECIIETPW